MTQKHLRKTKFSRLYSMFTRNHTQIKVSNRIRETFGKRKKGEKKRSHR